MYKQGERLKAKYGIEFVNPVTGRTNHIKKDAIMWVTSTSREVADGIVRLAKINQTTGYSLCWSVVDVCAHFERIES